MQGSLFKMQDIPDSAATVFQQIITSYPKCYDITKTLYALAEIYERLGLDDESGTLYNQILRQYYYSSLAQSARHKLWNLAIQSGRAGQVIQQMESERKRMLPPGLEPYIPAQKAGELLWFYANAQLREHRPLEALNALKNYLSCNPAGMYRAQALYNGR